MSSTLLPPILRRVQGQRCLVRSSSRENAELAGLTLANHWCYASEHGYDLLSLHEPRETAKWGLLPWLLDTLDRYEAIFCLGSDVIITNPKIPLTAFDVPDCGAVVAVEALWGGSAINNDTLLLYNNAKGHQYLQLLCEAATTWTHPYLQQSYTATLLVSHPGLVAVRPIQSFPLKSSPLAWKPGDFCLHYLTASNQVKADRVRKFLKTGQVSWYSEQPPSA